MYHNIPTSPKPPPRLPRRLKKGHVFHRTDPDVVEVPDSFIAQNRGELAFSAGALVLAIPILFPFLMVFVSDAEHYSGNGNALFGAMPSLGGFLASVFIGLGLPLYHYCRHRRFQQALREPLNVATTSAPSPYNTTWDDPTSMKAPHPVNPPPQEHQPPRSTSGFVQDHLQMLFWSGLAVVPSGLFLMMLGRGFFRSSAWASLIKISLYLLVALVPLLLIIFGVGIPLVTYRRYKAMQREASFMGLRD